MGQRDSSRRWVVIVLALYVLAVAVLVLSPVSYSDAVNRIGMVLTDWFGATGFGTGWIEFGGNILMFLPLGFLLTLLLRRHWAGVVVALAVSGGVELVQVLIPSRQPSLRDVLANVLGAAVGAALAWLLVLRQRHPDRRRSAD